MLVIYGWFGAGINTMLVVTYQHVGFDEWRVGLMGTAMTVGTVLSSILIAPRLRMQGGITNFRLCFISSLVAAALLVSLGLYATLSQEFKSNVARNQEAMAQARNEFDGISDEAGDLRIELRWLATEVIDIIEMLEEDGGRASGSRRTATVLEDLTLNIAELRRLIAKNQAAEEAVPEDSRP